MGCTASINSIREIHKSEHRAVRESSSSSPAPVDLYKKPAPGKLRIDALHCEQLSKDWVKRYSIGDGGERVTVDMVLKDTLNLLRNWPRGELAGHFLTTPIHSKTNLSQRGVKLSWLLGAWHHMTANTNRHLISTRMFVELFARPLLLGEKTDEEDLCLYDYVPLEFRSAPTVFVSHAWDGYFRHILFFPETLRRSWPADPSLWVDIFACPQMDDGPNPERLSEIKETIQGVARTVVVFPGDGNPTFAILPMLRSWCIFEVLSAPKDSVDFRVGLHGDLNDVEFHSKVVELIDGLTVEAGLSTYMLDKNEIESALASNGSVQNNTALRSLTRAAFAKRYEGVPTTPSMNNRLSNGSNSSRRSRMDSMSDIYTVDEIKLEDVKLPDF